MKNKLLLFSMTLLAAGVVLCPNAAFAGVDQDSEEDTYTLVVPRVYSVVTTPSSNTFGLNDMTLSDFGVADVGNHVITVGDGGTIVSYVQTNDDSASGYDKVTMSFTAVDGLDTFTLADSGGTAATLTVADDGAGGTTASVNIKITNSAGNDYPTMTDGTTPVDLGIVGATLVADDIKYDAANKSWIDMEMDVDETSIVVTDDPPVDMSFKITTTLSAS